jgi:ribosomal subunit interface protein
MDVTINTQHCTVPESLRDQTERRVSRLDRYHPRATFATVIYQADRGLKQCEARIHVAGGPPLCASSRDSSFRGALDNTVARLERQLKRQRERRRRRGVEFVRTA